MANEISQWNENAHLSSADLVQFDCRNSNLPPFTESCFTAKIPLERVDDIVEHADFTQKDRPLSRSDSDSDSEDDATLAQVEQYAHVWNINMFSVLSWKSLHSAVGAKHSSNKPLLKRMMQAFPRYLFRTVPFMISVVEILLLIGILDEGCKIKTLVEHDGIFRLPFFMWAKTTKSLDANSLMIGWLQERNQEEAENCMTVGLRLENYTTMVKFSDHAFFELYQQNGGHTFSRDLDWALSHCFPWAYAGVCINIMSTGAELNNVNSGGCESPGGLGPCSYRSCSMPNEISHRMDGSNRISVEDWKSVLVPLDEVQNLLKLSEPIMDSQDVEERDKLRRIFLNTYTSSVTYRIYDEKSGFICWFMQNMLNKRNSFLATKTTLSTFLFQKLHYVYLYGVEESHILEFLAVICLSMYVYFTAIFDELDQVFHQVYAHSELSRIKDAFVGLHIQPGSANPTARQDKLHFMVRYARFVSCNFICDVFLALRMVYIACMCQTTVMIIAWDHGVIEVVLSSLAITFLLEVDDKLMKTLCQRLEFNDKHRQTIDSFKRVVRNRILFQNTERDEPCKYLRKAVILKIATFTLMVALCGNHLYQTIILISMRGLRSEDKSAEAQNIKEFFLTLESRFLPLSAGIAGASMLCNLMLQGAHSVISSISLGLSLGWVMQTLHLGINNGILFDSWNMFDVGAVRVGAREISDLVERSMFVMSESFGLPIFFLLHVCWSLCLPGFQIYFHQRWHGSSK